MVKRVKPKNDVKKPVCRITERMKVGKAEAETGKEPLETEVTSLRDVKSCVTWIETNGKADHLYKIYKDDVLDSRWHHRNNKWLKALQAPAGMRTNINDDF